MTHRKVIEKLFYALLLVLLLGCAGAFGKAMKQGDRFAAAGQWDAAAAEYERAVGLKPSDPKAQQKLAEARRHQAMDREAQAKAKLAENDLSAALSLLQEARGLDPSYQPAIKLLAEVSEQALDKAEQMLEGDEPAKAFELTTLVLEGDPDNSRARALDGQARDKLAARAYAAGEAHTQAHKHGNALLEFAAADELVPGYRDCVTQMARAKQELEQAATYYVVVGRFAGDARAQDLAARLTIDSLSDGLGDAGRLELVSAAVVQGVDGLQLSGTMSGYRYDHGQQRSARTCSYVCGTKTAVNAAYTAAKAALAASQQDVRTAAADVQQGVQTVGRLQPQVDSLRVAVDRQQLNVDRAKLDLDRCEQQNPPDGSGVDHCLAERQRVELELQQLGAEQARLDGPEQELSAAQQNLAAAEQRLATSEQQVVADQQTVVQTPPTVQVDRHCDHRYTVVRHTVKANVSLRLSSVALGQGSAASGAGPRTFRVNESDDTFPAQSGRCAEVAAGDPLDIPSEVAAKNELGRQAVDDVRRHIVTSYEQHRQRLLTTGRKHEAAGRIEQATETLMRYLLATPKSKRDQTYDDVIKAVAGARGLSDATIRQVL